MANHRCFPLPEHHAVSGGVPHHLHHHVAGRFRRYGHSGLPHAASSQPINACGKGSFVAGEPGGLPSLPAGRDALAPVRKAAGMSGGAKGLAALAAAVVGSAALGATWLGSAPARHADEGVTATGSAPSSNSSSQQAGLAFNMPSSTNGSPMLQGWPSTPSSVQPFVPTTPPPGDSSPRSVTTPGRSPVPVPEPASVTLLGIAMGAALLARRHIKR